MFASKGGHTSNLMMHLMTHGMRLKAERCTVFDSLRDPVPSTSAVCVAIPGPNDVETTVDDDSRSVSTGY